MRLGIAHVERDILRGLTAKQFRAWEQFEEVCHGIDETRADYRAASIVQMLFNINRGKNQQPGKLDDFVLKFEEKDDVQKPKQTTDQQVRMLKLLAVMHAGEGEVTPTPPGAAPGPAQIDAAMQQGTITFAEQDALDAARKAMQ